MPGLLETCDELFQTKDLYVVLGIDKTANSGQIKKAYHKVNFSSTIYIVTVKTQQSDKIKQLKINW